MSALEIYPPPPDTGEAKLRLEWVDIAKGMSIMLIVVLHTTTLIEATGGSPYWFTVFNGILTPIRVPLFFVASGLFARATVTGDTKRLLSKVLRLFWVFGLWLLITELYYRYGVGLPYNPEINSPFWKILYQLVAPQSVSVWFLWALGIFFIGARLAMATALRAILALAALLSLIVTIDRSIVPFSDNLAIRNSASYFVFFLAPIVYPQMRGFLGNMSVIRGLAAAFPVYLLFMLVPTDLIGPFGKGFARMGATVFGVAVLLLIARRMQDWNIMRGLFNYIGKRTLPIYVMHFPVISTLAVGARALGLWGNSLVEYAGNVVLTVFGVLVCIALAWLAKRVGLHWLFALPAVWQRRLALLRPAVRVAGA